jgi:Tfp pilus assembly protein PilW
MRRGERGVTLLELIVAVAIGFFVILGMTTFYLTSLRLTGAANSQVALQRQGAMIADDIGRRLRSAQGVTIEDPSLTTGNCMPLTTNDPVLVITDQTGAFWCYYRDTSTPPQIVRCVRANAEDPCIGGSVLSGSLSPLTAAAWTATTVTPCDALGGTCDVNGVCSVAQSCGVVPGANVAFTVSDGVNDPLAFGLAFVFQRH